MKLIVLIVQDMMHLKPNTPTKYSIPSYAVFNDGIYPQSYPPHLNPPAQKDPVDNTSLGAGVAPYTQSELEILNRQIYLHNSQRRPIQLDFVVLANLIERIAIARP
jgi:hypothetical protein